MLFFRAGPQDFPHDGRLALLVPLLAIAGNILFLSAVLPPAVSAVIGVTMVLLLGLFTRAVLRARKFLPRFQQTFNSLLVTDLALKLAMLPAFHQLAPRLAEIAQHPELLNDPDKLALPGGAVLIANLVSYWSLAVSTNIYRQAAEVNVFLGLLLTILALIILLFGTGIASGMLRAALA